MIGERTAGIVDIIRAKAEADPPSPGQFLGAVRLDPTSAFRLADDLCRDRVGGERWRYGRLLYDAIVLGRRVQTPVTTLPCAFIAYRSSVTVIVDNAAPFETIELVYSEAYPDAERETQD